MQVTVGTVIGYRGNNYICVSTEIIDIYSLAKEDSATIKQWTLAGENVKHLDLQVEDFEQGDTIHTTGERIQLESPGVDMQFIWTRHRIEKVIKEEINDGQQGSEGASGESPSGEVESVGRGDKSGQGTGEKAPGEVSSSIHSDGQSGEGGDVVHTGNSESS